VLVCDEVGTVFPNPRDLTQATYGALDIPSYFCPNCGKISISEFKNSTGQEIQKLGFTVGEYE
jgi:hypothetical protein